MSEQIPNCPQPETPIRERAWTPEQQGPRIVCCVCGDPCGIYSPICAKCDIEMLTIIEED